MEGKEPKISDAEMEIMTIIWNSTEAITTNDILRLLPEENSWKLTTVLTLASRLVDKGILSTEKKGKANYYSASMTEEQYKQAQSRAFLKDVHNGSIKNFIATMYNDKKMDKKQLEEVKQWFLEEIE